MQAQLCLQLPGAGTEGLALGIPLGLGTAVTAWGVPGRMGWGGSCSRQHRQRGAIKIHGVMESIIKSITGSITESQK